MPPHQINPELDLERISILYENTNVGYIIDQLASIQAAYPWMIIVTIAYIPRVTLSIMFARKMKAGEITYENVNLSENYFFYNSILPFFVFLQRRVHPLWIE